MPSSARRLLDRTYERLLEREIDGAPTHVAVIQDGNRRYADEHGKEAADGHRAGAKTTERVLDWCADVGVEELTLYAFSTENFDRPPEENERLFELLDEKLREFADAERVHDREVSIRAIGETDRLPDHLRDAIEYAENRTRRYNRLRLNVALAYGGRAELLGAARDTARAVERGDLAPGEIDASEIDRRLYEGPARDVDLIIRTGGDERTSNFLPLACHGRKFEVRSSPPVRMMRSTSRSGRS